MVLIRAATRNDALSISQVHVSSWWATYEGIVPAAFLNELNAEQRTPRWQKVIESESHLIVAESDTQILGFINGGPIREPLAAYDAELYAIYLLEEVQRRGLGRALLIDLAQQLHGAGFHNLIAWVLEANDSRRFYEKTGAVIISQKEIEIGGASLPAIAYGWSTLESLAALERPRLFG